MRSVWTLLFFFEGYGHHVNLHGLTQPCPTRRASELRKQNGYQEIAIVTHEACLPCARYWSGRDAARLARAREPWPARRADRRGDRARPASTSKADRQSTRLNSSH